MFSFRALIELRNAFFLIKKVSKKEKLLVPKTSYKTF